MKKHLIAMEKYNHYKKMKITSLFGGGILFALTLFTIIFIIVVAIPEYKDKTPLFQRYIHPATVTVCIVLIFTAIIMWNLFSMGLRRIRMTIYEEGFVPYKVPKGYPLKKKEEFFVPWEDVVWVEFIDGLMWIYLIATKDRWGIAIAEMRFEKKDAPKVLEFMRKIEKMVEERGGYVVHKRWNPLRGWIIEYEKGKKPFKRVGPWYWPGFDQGNP